MATRINRLQVFSVVRYLLLQGKPGGRRAAAAVLEEFKGAESNRLVLQAIRDPDPQVQANALRQLRQRGIPGALTRLISLVDSPHEMVRSAARQSLDEFHFPRYLAAFDMLSDPVRNSTGLLVKKIDPRAVPQLVEELLSKSRTRRLRGLSVALAMDVSSQVEERVLELAEDSDHFVRAAAAKALARCDTAAARTALRKALLDRSVLVQEAAEQSLLALGEDHPSRAEAPAPGPAPDPAPDHDPSPGPDSLPRPIPEPNDQAVESGRSGPGPGRAPS
jgi:HEAT repeat protein